MRKPSGRVFLIYYAAIWLGLGTGLALHTAPHPLHGVIYANLIMVLINVMGMLVIALTGWAPWRDNDK